VLQPQIWCENTIIEFDLDFFFVAALFMFYCVGSHCLRVAVVVVALRPNATT